MHPSDCRSLPAGLLLVPPLLVALLTSSCNRHQMSGGISDSAFVAAMAGLRRLPVHSMIDSASRMAARDSILRANGLTAAQLEAAAAALASDPGRAAAIWDAVTRKENSPRDTGPTVQGADSSK